jgi:hypothetical protein
MYKSFQVLYSVGQRQDYAFTPNTNSYLLETVVQAIDATRARAMVEAMNGGPDRCSVNRVLPL